MDLHVIQAPADPQQPAWEAAFNPPFYANEHDFFEALTNDNEPNDQAAYRIICFDKRDYNFTEELNISQEMDDEQPEDNRAYQN